jgi:hypothetical protein
LRLASEIDHNAPVRGAPAQSIAAGAAMIVLIALSSPRLDTFGVASGQ